MFFVQCNSSHYGRFRASRSNYVVQQRRLHDVASRDVLNLPRRRRSRHPCPSTRVAARTFSVVLVAVFVVSMVSMGVAQLQSPPIQYDDESLPRYSPFQYRYQQDAFDRDVWYVFSYDIRTNGHVILYCTRNRLLVVLHDGKRVFRPNPPFATIRFDNDDPFPVRIMSNAIGVVIPGEQDVQKIAQGLRNRERMSFTIDPNNTVTIDLYSARESMARLDVECDRLRPPQ